ncbi:MAG: hypothetical protein FWF43_03185 [Propionibacteriaceae bacterium]|nr:hypothetical protein [Propionibacteriaceae bacterium]
MVLNALPPVLIFVNLGARGGWQREWNHLGARWNTMSRLRRTGSGDLVTPHLAMDVQSMYKVWGHQLIPTGTSSLGTAYVSTLLGTQGVLAQDGGRQWDEWNV